MREGADLMAERDRCEVYCYNEEVVNRVQDEVEQEDITGVARLFKVLADENRAKIAFALSKEKELCVCDVANIIGSSVATASHHLRTLKKMGLATYRKQGKLAFYSLNDDQVKQMLLLASSQQKKVALHD